MYETLMKSGNYRVDYVNESAYGTPKAFAFYVCGGMSAQVPYSLTARCRLLAGLAVIHQELGAENLVAVYMDIHGADQRSNAAYERMLNDLRAGMFRRIFIFEICNPLAWQQINDALSQLSFEVGSVELITYREGVSSQLIFSGEKTS